MDIILKLKEKYQNDMDRYNHILGVEKLAKKLAIKRNIDVSKASIAALLHDYYRYEDDDFLLENMFDSDREKYYGQKHMYHGLASAYAANKIFGINDLDIINAIKFHTSGRLEMSPLEEIIFISDYAEENRKYPSCILVREILEDNFYKAMYVCFCEMINHLKNKNVKISEEMYELRDKYYNLYKEGK